MNKEFISVIDIAREIGKSKQTVFKVLKRLAIEPKKLRAPETHGQLISYVSKEEAALIKTELQTTIEVEGVETLANESGAFYLIQLEPEYDPGRFKLGFATNIAERLRSHRCSAPFATVIQTWPCKLLWEKTAIESITSNCEKLHTEVFRADAISDIQARCNKFFSMMLSLSEERRIGIH
ncbi:MAG TPA: hypothetical protein PLD30_15640 [Candidatus Competibacteraceae bacterium]|nr:hypothetical protein [Candidatus Competibacteraceae bacterium]